MVDLDSFFFSSRRRHTRWTGDWSSDVCSSDLLAAEYAHRFAGAYDLAWWVNAEQAGLIGDQFAALGVALGCLRAGASEIGRASCRERGEVWVGAGALKKKSRKTSVCGVVLDV